MNSDMKIGVSIILLTWNGIDLVKECLPKVLRVTAAWAVPHEIIVVDNGSSDGTIAFLKKTYPTIKCVAFDHNLGFACANNEAVNYAQFDSLLFINNDIYLDETFIEPMYEALDDAEVFAVAPRMLRWDKETLDDGLRYGRYASGLFAVELESDTALFNEPHWVTFFCGGCFMCKTTQFGAFGGFDTLYTPYAWEDLDLGYRAWKRGYRVAYVPEAVAYHKREATTRDAFSNFFFITLMWKNKFIFMWKNLHSRRIIMSHLALLPWKLIKFLCNGRWRYVCGFFRAVPSLPQIIKKRKQEKMFSVRTDEEVLALSYALREHKGEERKQ